MKAEKRILTIFSVVVIALLVSATTPFSAMAEGETPPPTETPTAEVTTPTPDTPVATETPVAEEPPVTETIVPTEAPVEENLAAETVSEVLSQAPEGTDLVLLDEQGDLVPLASAEAEEILAYGDPIWCPATVVVPVPGVGGCTDPGPGNINYDPTKLTSLLAYLITLDPSVNGVIWIEKSFDSSVQDVVGSWTISGASFTNMDLYSLTIRGGWNGLGTGTVDTTDPSELNGRLIITGWQNTITLSDLLITGTSGGTALQVVTTKDITLTRVKVENNAGDGIQLNNSTGTGKVTISGSQSKQNGGAGLVVYSTSLITLNSVNVLQNLGAGQSTYLDNTSGALGAPITISSSHFDNNSGSFGLYVLSEGAITLNGVTASGNTLGGGAHLQNTMASTPKGVSVIGGSTFNNNKFNGLSVASKGVILGTDLTASGNGNIGANGDGADLSNQTGSGAGVTLTGTNIFTDNYGMGLDIRSSGPIALNSIIANGNDGNNHGASLDNTFAATPQPITLTGTSQFKYNYNSGLYIVTRGQVTLNNITASGNLNNYGIYINNCQWSVDHCTGIGGFALTGVNALNDNGFNGINAYVAGAIKLNSLTASWNGSYGAVLNNCHSFGVPATCWGTQGATLSGTNNFNDNGAYGLFLESSGAILINNLTASGNGSSGARISNNLTGSTGTVLFTGANIFQGNAGMGLQILSRRAVTLNNITATGNLGGGGASIDNCQFNAGFCEGAGTVTIGGTNQFNGNGPNGLVITGGGAVVLNNISAIGNVANGASIDNCGLSGGNCTLFYNVTLNGTNYFNQNGTTGLAVKTGGAIKTNNITALDNEHLGIQLNNNDVGSTGGVTMTGFNVIRDNSRWGLTILSRGAILLSNLTITGNGFGASYAGVDINNSTSAGKPVTLSGINNISSNKGTNLNIQSSGIITIYSLTANDSDSLHGAILHTSYNSPVYNSVVLLGTSTFSGNGGSGITITSSGIVKASGVNASGNAADGMSIQNTNGGPSAPRNVILSGSNTFDGNGLNGLYVLSYGSILVNNVHASGNGVSTYGFGVTLENNTGSIPRPVSLTGINVINDNWSGGLRLFSNGGITINSLTANDNGVTGGFGANITNDSGSAIGGVTMTGTNTFNNNYSFGLNIASYGAITISNLTASGNLNSYGAQLTNSVSPLVVSPGVTLTGKKNTFDFNDGFGLAVHSLGSITASNLTAISNAGGYGVSLWNNYGSSTGSVTISGAGVFNENYYSGLDVESFGSITLMTTKVTANGNGIVSGVGAGVVLENTGAATPKNVVVGGISTYDGNYSGGLSIGSLGKIQVGNITALNSLDGRGLWLINDGVGAVGDVVLSGTNNFNGNAYDGLRVESAGAITLNNITANSNGSVSGKGAVLVNVSAGAPKPVVLTGTNTFDINRDGGLQVSTYGLIKINNLTASNSVAGGGAALNNSAMGSLGDVILTGYARFIGNATYGLDIATLGNVSITRLIADMNGQDGVFVSAAGNITLMCGSVTHNGVFGLDLNTAGTVTMTGVFTAGNTLQNIEPSGMTGSIITVRNCPLP